MKSGQGQNIFVLGVVKYGRIIMGKEDVAVNRLLERKSVFADLINGSLYGGKQVINARELEVLSPRMGVIFDDDAEGREPPRAVRRVRTVHG